MDTASLDLMQDFFHDRSTTKLLEIECSLTDDFLSGHARRVGLAGEQILSDTLAQLLPTIRYDVLFESDRIRDAGFENYLRVSETKSPQENAVPLAQFLSVDEDTARQIAETPYLFVD
jgi:hypothetical protein